MTIRTMDPFYTIRWAITKISICLWEAGQLLQSQIQFILENPLAYQLDNDFLYFHGNLQMTFENP